jgi:signal transduction histidine kinase
MAEPARVHASVFVKLLAIMLTMAISLLVLVTAFFIWILIPALNDSLGPFFDELARRVAATRPSLEAAERLSERLDLEIRYEGPDGRWATHDGLPAIAEARSETGHLQLGGGYRLAPAPGGGWYLFHWTFRRKTLAAHNALLALLLVLMAGTIVTAHLVIRRLLRPLRSLGDGVARLGSGELDVVLPAAPRDEFGLLAGAFNEMVARVRAMIRARDQLLVDVSHELRSPLTRMRVAIELLPEGTQRAGMTAEVAEMEAMIAELLELERLRDRGIRTARHNLAPLVREAVESFRDRPPGVRVASLPREIPVEIDLERMRTVLRNLLENAVKYSLPDSRAVEVSAACDDGRVVLSVRDDGPGIPEEDLPALFEPFFRVDRSRTKLRPGYGLGLGICKRIVEAHGGGIEARNEAGRGATFVVTLPR